MQNLPDILKLGMFILTLLFPLFVVILISICGPDDTKDYLGDSEEDRLNRLRINLKMDPNGVVIVDESIKID